jgi:hypothetical protein
MSLFLEALAFLNWQGMNHDILGAFGFLISLMVGVFTRPLLHPLIRIN